MQKLSINLGSFSLDTAHNTLSHITTQNILPQTLDRKCKTLHMTLALINILLMRIRSKAIFGDHKNQPKHVNAAQ